MPRSAGASCERFGPPNPIRVSVHTLREQLTTDAQPDLSLIGYLPNIDPQHTRRLLETIFAGAVALDSVAREGRSSSASQGVIHAF